MNTLPKYFVIKWVDSPLWREYIDWLNFKCNLYDKDLFFTGNDNDGFYGYCDDPHNGRNGALYLDVMCKPSKHPVITLEQWKQAISAPEPVKSKDMHRYFKVQLFPNYNKLAEELSLMACMSNSGLNVTLDGLNNHAAEHLNGSSCTVNGNLLVLSQGERTVLIIEERDEFVMPEMKDY